MTTVLSRRAAALGLLSLLLLASGCSFTASRRGPDTILILYTNDVHSHLVPGPDGIGGMARIAGYVERERAFRPDVLLLDAGDAVSGTPVSSLFLGRPQFAVMNTMGYDAMTIGNHEFDHGWQRIGEYREIAAFPLLLANARGPGGKSLGDAEWTLVDVDGVKVGIIGVLTPMTPGITAPGTTEGCTFRPPAPAIRRLLPVVGKRADLVVVLSHLGYEEDLRLAREVPGIDVIVGGHSHTEVTEPVRVGGTLVVQAYEYGKRLGRLELTVEVGRITKATGRLVTVDETLPISGRTAAAVRIWEEKVTEKVDVCIGRAGRAYKKEELVRPVEAIYRATLRTDLAFQNPGGIRAGLPEGDILIRHVFRILPFDNTLVVVRVRGANLPERMCPADSAVDPERIYTVATNSFVAGHADRYFPQGVEGVTDTGIPMRGAVLDWIRKHGAIE